MTTIFSLFSVVCLHDTEVTLLFISLRRGGRVAECTGLENQQGLIAPREFKSLLLRHYLEKPEPIHLGSGFLLSGYSLMATLISISTFLFLVELCVE